MTPSFEILLCNKTMVILVDRDDGPTVTNAPNEALEWLDLQLEGGIKGRRVIYRDTANRFDEILHSKGRAKKFKSLSEESQSFYERVMERHTGSLSLRNKDNRV